MGITSLTTGENHGAGKDSGDDNFDMPITAGVDESIVRLKITETHYIEAKFILIENELNPAGEEPLLAFIMSDTSDQGYDADFGLEELDPLDIFFTITPWKMTDRTWAEYPKDVMNALTTLEDLKPPTCIIVVSKYCMEL